MRIKRTRSAHFAMVVTTLVVPIAVSACASGHQAGAGSTPVERAFVRAAPTWDVDHDGTVTCEEWKLYAGQLFASVDTAATGFLTPEAFRALAAQDHLFEIADFAYFDVNRDGRVSRAEFVDRANPAFTLLDKDHDCRLTNEEQRVSYGLPPEPAKSNSGADAGKKPRHGGG